MAVEGKLEISLFAEDGRVSQVEIASSRPLRLTKLFAGKTPDEALVLIGSLYSVCGIAQKAAALSAIEAAMGHEKREQVLRARGLAVWAETAREHILRIAMDWGDGKPSKDLPPIIALPGRVVNALGDAFTLGGQCEINRVQIGGQIDLLEAYIEKEILGSCWSNGAEEWIAARETPMAARVYHIKARGWADLGEQAKVGLLPSMEAGSLAERFADPDYVAKPDWQGGVCETTALIRTGVQGRGLLARMVALVAELAAIPQRLRDFLNGPGESPTSEFVKNWGISQLEAARGRLVHGVQLTDGKVGAYRILAPTEWNFHPEGIAARILTGLEFEDEASLIERARQLICAIDPCVAFEIKVG